MDSINMAYLDQLIYYQFLEVMHYGVR